MSSRESYVPPAARDGAAIHVDVIGVGASPYDFLQEQEQEQHVVGVNVSEAPTGPDKSGRLRFNRRSQLRGRCASSWRGWERLARIQQWNPRHPP
jgi:hypothetical protein